MAPTTRKAAAAQAPVPSPKRSEVSVFGAFGTLADAYRKETPVRVKLIDSFLVFLVLTGVAQFAYCILLSDYPFNSYLAGYVHGAGGVLTSDRFSATVGQFVLAVALRMQTRPASAANFAAVNGERCVCLAWRS